MRRLGGFIPNPVSFPGSALSLERSARGGAAVPRRWKPRAEIAVAGQRQVKKSRCWDRWTGAVFESDSNLQETAAGWCILSLGVNGHLMQSCFFSRIGCEPFKLRR